MNIISSDKWLLLKLKLKQYLPALSTKTDQIFMQILLVELLHLFHPDQPKTSYYQGSVELQTPKYIINTWDSHESSAKEVNALGATITEKHHLLFGIKSMLKSISYMLINRERTQTTLTLALSVNKKSKH